MNQKELRDLIEFLIEKDITEFELERGDVKVRIRRGGEAAAAAYVPAAAAAASGAASAGAPAAAPPAAKAEEEGLHSVKSPIVGTFYESPSPGSPPFVKVGDAVEAGQVLCIIEAMKLMNEIESDVAGEVVKRLASNGQPVEYGQALFVIKPRG
jgi:acetyl-CoA carboxylase biotin carboxyl carrier protein